MLKNIALFGVIFLTLLCMGCIEDPSPISKLPKIKIDYIEDVEETVIFVRAIEDYLFTNITIIINDEKTTENFTYMLSVKTELMSYDLNVEVWDENKHYEYTGNQTLYRDDNEMRLRIIDDRHNEPVERSMPYSIIMERED